MARFLDFSANETWQPLDHSPAWQQSAVLFRHGDVISGLTPSPTPPHTWSASPGSLPTWALSLRPCCNTSQFANIISLAPPQLGNTRNFADLKTEAGGSRARGGSGECIPPIWVWVFEEGDRWGSLLSSSVTGSPTETRRGWSDQQLYPYSAISVSPSFLLKLPHQKCAVTRAFELTGMAKPCG